MRQEYRVSKSGDSLALNATELLRDALGVDHGQYVSVTLPRDDQHYSLLINQRNVEAEKRREFERRVNRIYDDIFHDDESSD